MALPTFSLCYRVPYKWRALLNADSNYHTLPNKCAIHVEIISSLFHIGVMKSSFRESRDRLFEVAQSQAGFFTAKQAEDAGFDRSHHTYHVQAGNWEREHRGVFRLKSYPLAERPDLILWSLWSRGTDHKPQGVYSHQTALGIHDLSDLMPEKLFMTVPETFRRSAKIPAILQLRAANLPEHAIEQREGYRVTRPMQTILDVANSHVISEDMLRQAFRQARKRGLVTEMEIRENKSQLPTCLTRRSMKAEIV
jgi:hypothetical protein